jgi:O-methyltransferase
MNSKEVTLYASAFIRYQTLYQKYSRYTMVGRLRFLENLALADVALNKAALQDGVIIECGTWKGGMAAALIEVGGPTRKYYFFDSFEGLPPAQNIDGEMAEWYQANPDAAEYHDNCAATFDEFKSTIALARAPFQNINIVRGFFHDTFTTFDSPPVAILRLDGDWYSSTMACLVKFWDAVLPGGLILIDDYYHWEGCTKAVHEFLAARKASERIRQGRIGGVAFIRKELTGISRGREYSTPNEVQMGMRR